ncbi:hypothetical protein ACRPLT_004377 [Citrobacter freundii]
MSVPRSDLRYAISDRVIVYRTDIRGYYRHIQKAQLYNHLCRFVDEPALRQLLHQYLYYSVEDGSEIHTPGQGICRGCSLSLLMGQSSCGMWTKPSPDGMTLST